MSYVTSVVVVLPEGRRDLAEKFGLVMHQAHDVTNGREPSDYAWTPIPMMTDAGVWLTDGGKAPSGTVFRLGLNYAHMDEILEILGQDEDFHGAWVWWNSEDDDEPSTHLVGSGGPSASAFREAASIAESHVKSMDHCAGCAMAGVISDELRVRASQEES